MCLCLSLSLAGFTAWEGQAGMAPAAISPNPPIIEMGRGGGPGRGKTKVILRSGPRDDHTQAPEAMSLKSRDHFPWAIVTCLPWVEATVEMWGMVITWPAKTLAGGGAICQAPSTPPQLLGSPLSRAQSLGSGGGVDGVAWWAWS